MDQMGHWVRFADTKATILTAGLGVVLTMLINNVDTVVASTKEGCQQATVVWLLGGLTTIAFLATLWFLVRAIGPRRHQARHGINRFAWPSLQGATADQLVTHAATTDPTADAWQQVTDLARLADRKFRACEHAIHCFAALVVLGSACVVTAHILAG